MDLTGLTARIIAQKIRENKLTPLTLVEHYLERIERLNPSINALRFVNKKQALKLARERTAEAKNGQIRGRLHGLVFCVKDHIDVEGLPRSEGSPGTVKDRSDSSASVVSRLFHEGAICIGKSNMAELGKSYTTQNPLYGRTNNPFDLEYSPGGSSGGDAAAVAAGFADFAISSDAGGSIRLPANFCGLFGLYNTPGVISNAGLTSYSHTTSLLFRSLGPITKSLEDLALINQVITGFDPAYPFSIPLNTQLHETENFPRKFAYFTSLNGVPCEKDINVSIDNCVKLLESKGYQAEEYCPSIFAETLETYVILGAQADLILSDLNAEAGLKTEAEGPAMQTLRKRISEELPSLTTETLMLAWHSISKLRYQTIPLFQKYAFILSPVAAISATKHGVSKFSLLGKERRSEEVFQFASAANVLGLPALAFPTGKTSQGLPTGLQLIGPRFSERRMISVLRSIEMVGRNGPPPLN